LSILGIETATKIHNQEKNNFLNQTRLGQKIKRWGCRRTEVNHRLIFWFLDGLAIKALNDLII